jgi:hypothetical protein
MNRVQQARAAYPEHVEAALLIADPKHNNKYLLWIAKQLAEGHSREDIEGTVESFIQNQQRLKEKDIYSYPDLSQLENEIKDLDESNRQKSRTSKNQGSRLIYEDDHCKVVRVDSKSAILYYGKGTRWCIAMETGTYWETYSKQGHIFYVLINKDEPNDPERKKFCIQRTGLINLLIWNAADGSMSIDTWTHNFKQFEKPVLRCLQDEVPSMWVRMAGGIATRKEGHEWLKYQHKSTLSVLRKSFPYYFADPSAPTDKFIKMMGNLKTKDIEKIIEEDKEAVLRVVEHLKENPEGNKKLRQNLGRIFPEHRDDFLTELQRQEIRFQDDPAAVMPLLLNCDEKVWGKYIKRANPEYLLQALLRSKLVFKRRELANQLRNKVKDFEPLFKLLAEVQQNPDIETPTGIFGADAEER